LNEIPLYNGQSRDCRIHSSTPERDYDDNFYIIIKKILGDIIFDYDYIDAREDEVIVNFKLLYGYAALLPNEEEKYKKFKYRRTFFVF